MKTITMKFSKSWPAAAAMLVLAGTAQASLIGRDITGNAVAGGSASSVFLYDTVLNVTWLRDANANPYGLLSWIEADNWARGLNVGGFTNWRLPTMIASPNATYAYGGTDYGYNVRTTSGATVYSEMASLFYDTLGNKAWKDTSGNTQFGYGLANKGDFKNLQSADYWSDLESPQEPRAAYIFNTGFGNQYDKYKASGSYAMAVRPGDVAASVPEPQTLALVLLALGATGVARRRRTR